MHILRAPSLEHPLGTDDLGRDVLARMAHGARISLSVGFVAVGIAVALVAWFAIRRRTSRRPPGSRDRCLRR